MVWGDAAGVAAAAGRHEQAASGLGQCTDQLRSLPRQLARHGVAWGGGVCVSSLKASEAIPSRDTGDSILKGSHFL